MFIPNDSVTVSRLSWAGIKRSYNDHITDPVVSYIYEIDQQLAMVYGIDWGQDTAKMIVSHIDIKEWDKVKDKQEAEWIVKKVITRRSVVTNFLEVVIVKENE